MKLTKTEVFLTKIPVIRAHKMAIGTTLHQECVFVKLFADNGIYGWGEAPHMVRHSGFGETQQTVASTLRDFLLPVVLGQEATEMENHQINMDKAVPWNYRAKSAVNIALYDILGKWLDTPVYNVLGGKCRDRVPVSWSIPITDFTAGVQEAQQMIAEKEFKILKVKVGREDAMEDVEMVKRIRESVGKDIRLRVDANQAYDVKTAIRVANAIGEFDVEFFEQPVSRYDLEGLALVNKSSPVPIMADESADLPCDVYEIIRHRAADIISVYTNNAGGLLNAKKMIAVAETADLGCYNGGALEGPVGTSACLHLVASSPSMTYGMEKGGEWLLKENISQEPIKFEDGSFIVPDVPGLGVELDQAKVDRYLIDRFEVTI